MAAYYNPFSTTEPLYCTGPDYYECNSCRDGYYLNGSAPNFCIRKERWLYYRSYVYSLQLPELR